MAGTDSDPDDPIDKYILDPASKRFGSADPEGGPADSGRKRREQNGADDAAAAAAAAAAAKKQRRKSKSKSRRSSKDKSPKAAAADHSGSDSDPGGLELGNLRHGSGSGSDDPDGGGGAAGGRHHVRAPPAGGAAAAGAGGAAAAAGTPGPRGVVLVDDDGDAAAPEMWRLLRGARAPRYFDEGAPLKGVACWRCGKRGHVARDCRCAGSPVAWGLGSQGGGGAWRSPVTAQGPWVAATSHAAMHAGTPAPHTPTCALLPHRCSSPPRVPPSNPQLDCGEAVRAVRAVWPRQKRLPTA